MARFGTVELGGTKVLAAVGSSADDLSAPYRIPTGDPKSTLGAVVEHLAGFSLDAVGIASFGPIEARPGHADFGTITTTPKPGWSGIRVVEFFEEGLGLPVGFDTDVNGAALGEGRWGAARGLSDFVYLTVGTGIGGGVIAKGSLVGGISHPEVGHLAVVRHPDDDYAGRCPYHGACLEGMASGPALVDRFGPRETWADRAAEALDLAVHYLAQALRDLVYVLSPERIVVGGGVSENPGFHSKLAAGLASELHGYPGLPEHGEGFVVPPGLGELSGLAGGLLLAARALG